MVGIEINETTDDVTIVVTDSEYVTMAVTEVTDLVTIEVTEVNDTVSIFIEDILPSGTNAWATQRFINASGATITLTIPTTTNTDLLFVYRGGSYMEKAIDFTLAYPTITFFIPLDGENVVVRYPI